MAIKALSNPTTTLRSTARPLGNDFFADLQNAFNVYRVNLVSAHSGISQREYGQNGTPNDRGVILSKE